MSRFVLDEINNVNGQITFYRLIEDEHCYYNEFCMTMEREGTYYDQVFRFKSQMNDKANLQPLSKSKHKAFATHVKGVSGFEFRTYDLRLYGIDSKLGNIIILGGKKSDQSKNEVQFRSIVKRYSESIK
jgi:hypothetical protein